jgi:hypothetical protein
MIAVYKDGPERKLRAVESVREARAMGIEAYYYHGENVSNVCVGAWPREAIAEQHADGSQAVGDASKPVLVLPPGIRSDSANALADSLALPENANKEATRVIQKVEVVDPSLLQAMRQYPYHAVNGEEILRKSRNPQTGKFEMMPEPSMIVMIPRAEPSLLDSGGRMAAGGSPTPTTPTAVNDPPPAMYNDDTADLTKAGAPAGTRKPAQSSEGSSMTRGLKGLSD